MLKRIGLSPGKKLLVFFISAVLVTLPLGYAYNSIAIVLFVLYSLLSAKKDGIYYNVALLLPAMLYLLMALSLLWSIDCNSTFRALSKEASLLFIPLAFCFNNRFIRIGRKNILRNYSIAMVLAALFFVGRAVVRYTQTGNHEVFFYHELSTFSINAIYLSALFSVPLFYFLTVKKKTWWVYSCFIFLFVVIFLLSSKTAIIIDVLLTATYMLFYSRMPKKARVTVFLVFIASAVALGYYGKIKERLVEEFTTQATLANGVNNLTVKDALTKEKFSHNDYFNGVAFRAYQGRVFTELAAEEPSMLLTGYGLNASLQKVNEKGTQLNVHPGSGDGINYGYSLQNFHNQYIETFADLGIFGFLLLLVLLGFNLKKALQGKDFVHIAFAILMIALLLTESFLWRQRGVVFFTVLYCLFNGLAPKGFEKKYEKNPDNGSGRLPGVTPM